MIGYFHDAKDGFKVLDMQARLGFKTKTSISYKLERYSASLCPRRQLGWIDVHYPTEEDIKVQIRVCLPSEYHTHEKMKPMIDALLEALVIPSDESCEAAVFATSAVVLIADWGHGLTSE